MGVATGAVLLSVHDLVGGRPWPFKLGVSPTSTGISASRPAGLGGDAGGILAGTDFLADLGAAFLRVLGALAAEAGIAASKVALHEQFARAAGHAFRKPTYGIERLK